MTVWFTSDLHIGHKLVADHRLAERGAWDENPTEWHDYLLGEHWDELVRADDVIWVLGDISAGGSKAQLNALEWIKARPGKKHLIAGNHDSVHPMHRDAHKWMPIYLDGAFETVQTAARRYIPLSEGRRQEVLLSHFPYDGEGDRVGKDRYTQWRLRDEGTALLHGHVHSQVQVTRSRLPVGGVDGLYMPAKQVHVGLDAWDLKPVSLEQIAEVLQ